MTSTYKEGFVEKNLSYSEFSLNYLNPHVVQPSGSETPRLSHGNLKIILSYVAAWQTDQSQPTKSP